MRMKLNGRAAKAAVFGASLAPFAWFALRASLNDLGANPIEAITRATGTWTLNFLLASLSITPLRRLLAIPELIRFRRMLGLFAYFYGCLHLLTYLWLDQFFDWPGLWRDIARRPFITAGVMSFMLMTPLAITSTAGWIRRIGGARWRVLHRLVYPCAALGVLHYLWLVKSDVCAPLAYGAVLAALLLARANWRGRVLHGNTSASVRH